jgi:hypothetical protein
LCRLMGHNWVEGYKFKSAKSEGCSKVCCRCGFYENTIINPASKPIATSSKMTISH